ncbi:alpha/beta hydrolase [Phycisphaeraceae bacterium D3-23]
MQRLLRAVLACLFAFLCAGCSLGFGKPMTSGGTTGITPEPAMTEGSGWKVAWYRAGDPDAPRILYLHGTPGSASDYEAYLLDPLPGRESVAADRVGFGRSEAGPDKHGALVSFEQQAVELAPLLVERGGAGTLIVGHSLGGPIALRLAADYPDRVAGVVVLAG